jgi:multiple sugar transport system permease protein/putative aldouronate transport system permease protein
MTTSSVRTRTPRALRLASTATSLVKGVILTLACAVVIVPFLGIVSTSLASRKQVTESGGFVLWPESPSFDSYIVLFDGGVVTRALGVSVFVTLTGTVLSLTCTALLAYSLSRPGSFAHKPLLMTVLFTLLFTPGIIPSYLL